MGLGDWLDCDQGDIGGRNQWPVVRVRRVHLFPAELGRALAAGMAELQANPGLAIGMDEVGDPPPRGDMLVLPHAGATRRDAGRRRWAGHFREDQPGAALSPRAEMHEVEIPRHAVDRGVHGHRRDHDAVRQFQFPQLEWCEHRPGGFLARWHSSRKCARFARAIQGHEGGGSRG